MIKSSHCYCSNRKGNFSKEVLAGLYNTGGRKVEDNFFQGCLEKAGAQFHKANY